MKKRVLAAFSQVLSEGREFGTDSSGFVTNY